MKKLFVILVGVFCIFCLTTPQAMAGGNIVVRDNQVGLANGDQVQIGGNANKSTFIGGDVNYGLLPENLTVEGGKAVIKKGAVKNNVDIDNTVDIDIDNKNVNRNTNKQKQQQGQQQGQLQLQGQAQKQKQGQDQDQDQSQMNDWVQIFEDKRDHIQGPEIVQPDAKFTEGKTPDSKTYGSELLDHIDSLFMKQAKKLSSKASDIEVLPALMFENDFITNRVYIKDHSIETGETRGNLMGYFYADCDGKKCNAASMIGEVAEKAMKVGATHIYLEDKDKVKNAMGSSWNIGIGGGASIMANGDDVAIAPNGGLGFGSATANNELRPAMAFSVWFDDDTIVEKSKKHEVDYSNQR